MKYYGGGSPNICHHCAAIDNENQWNDTEECIQLTIDDLANYDYGEFEEITTEATGRWLWHLAVVLRPELGEE